MSTTTLFQKPESQPKPYDKPPQRCKCHRYCTTIKTSQNPQTTSMNVPLLACDILALLSLTHTLKDIPIPPWAVGDNVPYSISFACGLLILPSLTHTLKDLPLPPMGSKE